MLHEGDHPSKTNLLRNASSGDHNEPDERQQVIYRAAEFVEEFFAEREYCWAANESFRNEDKVLSGMRMPVMSAGLDHYKLCDGVASLECINPQPWVKKQLVKLLSLDDDHLYELWRFSSTYQTVGRCSLRVRNRNNDIDIIVVSRSCAETLAGLFSGSKIVGQLGDLPRFSSLTKRERVESKGERTYTTNDNAAYSKYRRRCGAKGEEVREKDDWFDKIRRPRLQGDQG